MLRRLALGPGATLRLRFDGASAPVRYKRLPESMQPKTLGENYTPFPLPKYDEDLGYGPVRLRNIPDVERAKRRSTGAMATTLADVLEAESTAPSSALSSSFAVVSSVTNPSPPLAQPASGTEEPLSGYVTAAGYPIIDRLECVRSLDDLLAQFTTRPTTEARSAALADMASTLPQRSNAELVRMFSEISAPFAPDGRGLNFLVTKVSKFGRPYAVTSALVRAYTDLLDAATTALVEEQPWRLPECPGLAVQLLHFMALIKVFEPNKWFTFSNHAPSNRADYAHPRGVNQTTSFWRTGEDLFDHITALTRDEGGAMIEACSLEELVDLLCGFAAVSPEGRASGDVFEIIQSAFRRRLKECHDPLPMALVERMYFATVMCDAGSEELLQLLLRCDTPGPRGPDFFSAVARSRRAEVHRAAVALLQSALENETSHIPALLESGGELLLAMRAKEDAVAFALRHEFDERTLRAIPHCEEVANLLFAHRQHLPTPMEPRAVQAQLLAANTAQLTHSDTCVPPLVSPSQLPRTLLTALPHLNSLDTVFLLHSSLPALSSVDSLIAAVHRLRSGKDGLIVTTSCLRELAVRGATAVKERERHSCDKALEIVAYELCQGRVVLVPFSEELRLHDAGVYCDEDLMLWTLAAFFARELPLVKAMTLMHRDSPARTPERFLKGPHSVANAPNALYNPDAPLLAALHGKELRLATGHAQLGAPVRDRKCTLYRYNPIRSRFVYRRDHALFEKYHVPARNLAPGFSRGALEHDWRGLGVYTPDHPQVPYPKKRGKERTAQELVEES